MNEKTGADQVTNDRAMDFLETKTAVLIVLVLALAAQLPHTAEVFMHVGNVHKLSSGWWLAGLVHSVAYAVALESAVLLFVVRRQQGASYLFACVSVLINLCYYAEQENIWSLSAWLISLSLPIAIALYSHAVAGDAQESFTVHSLIAKVHKPKKDVRPLIVQKDAQSEGSEAQPEAKTLAMQLFSEGLNKSQIAERLNVHRNTVRSWLGTMQMEKG